MHCGKPGRTPPAYADAVDAATGACKAPASTFSALGATLHSWAMSQELHLESKRKKKILPFPKDKANRAEGYCILSITPQ